MDTALISIIIIAIALAMDAFSVSLTKGFTQKKPDKITDFILWTIFWFFPVYNACNRIHLRYNNQFICINCSSMDCIFPAFGYRIKHDS